LYRAEVAALAASASFEETAVKIALPSGNSPTIIVATLTVLVLGVALSFSTWRNLHHQKDAYHEHALSTARNIAAGIEINLRREVRLSSMLDPLGTNVLQHRTMGRDLLRTYIQRTDARFVGLYNRRGHILLSSHNDPESLQAQLPTIAWERMSAGEWSGEMNFEGRPIMVLGRISRLGKNHVHRDGKCPPDAQPPLLLVGVDMTRHLEAFAKYRHTAILQTGYILAVTILFWTLLMVIMQRAEQGRRLRRLESFNAGLLDNMPDGLLTLSADGMIMSANPAALTLLGDQDVIGRNFAQTVQNLGMDAPWCPDQGWTTLRAGGKHLEVLQLPLKDDSAQTLVLIRDRTELAGLERELHRNEKLAAIGRMAAGVAHEIRNPLSALRGFAQFFSKKLAGRDPEESYARAMVQEADRLNRVITDLLFLARPRQLTFGQVALADIFAETENLLFMDLQAKNCTLEHDDGAGTVFADRDALKQVLINLVVNSVAAMPEQGGRIMVRSFVHEDDICIQVEDNGRGMSAEEREHALEPFYTTRDQGTGLGLAIVHTIMQEHGGTVSIETQPGSGTVVSLFFPR
jgi:signal transduction histidine kinase